LSDILILKLGVKKVIQTICKPNAVMPDGIGDKDEGDDEESFESQPSRGMFGFEEAVIDGLEKQFEVWHISKT